ncbi:MAG: tetratricopeptide repeat protein [Candidatus Wallbacteria bacterium]|nr:tetratricopeptide repeat protein [Candidatus Wallbacteria bacterium]
MGRGQKPHIVPLQGRRARKRRALPPSRPAPRDNPHTEPERLAESMPVRLEHGRRRDRAVHEVFEDGNRALLAGNFVAAAQRYRRALLLAGDIAEAYNNLAVACHRQGFFFEARRAVERAIDLAPGCALYQHNAALIARDAGEPTKALEYLSLALTFEPRSAPILQCRGLIHTTLRQFPEALADLSRALELDPSLPGLVCQVAVAASNAGDTGRARELLDRLTASQPHDPEPYYNLGFISLSMGDTPAGLKYLERARSLSPAHAGAAFQLASLYAKNRDENDNRSRAIAILESCIASSPELDVKSGRKLAPVYFLLASLYDDTADGYQQAMANYRAGLEWDPDFYVAHNNLGALSLERGDVEQALEHFSRALALRPTYAKACLNFAKALYRRGTEFSLEERIESLLAATGRQAPYALAIVARCLVDLAEHEVYAEIHERDHKIKNVLGLTGNRLRRMRSKLQDGPPAAELGEVLAVLENAYDSMGAYLRAIQPQANSTGRVDLNEIARRVAARTEQSRPEGCELTVTLAPDLPSIPGDPDRFEEAVLNLVANALESLSGPGHVRLRTEADEERGTVLVSVEDDGPGIPPALREAIFRTGYTTKASGNGLGLAIVRRTVAESHGTLEVSSAPGRATRFTMRFPLELEPLPRGGGLSMSESIAEDPGSLIVSELA